MSQTTSAKTENALVRYLRDTRAEIAKVTWPTRETGLRLTGIVLAVTVVSGIFLWVVDSTFNLLIATLIGLL